VWCFQEKKNLPGSLEFKRGIAFFFNKKKSSFLVRVKKEKEDNKEIIMDRKGKKWVGKKIRETSPSCFSKPKWML